MIIKMIPKYLTNVRMVSLEVNAAMNPRMRIIIPVNKNTYQLLFFIGSKLKIPE